MSALLRHLSNSCGDYPAILALGACIALGATVARSAIDPNEWKYEQSIEVQQSGLTKLSLPPSTLDLGRENLVDLRLLGPGGEEVPYFLHLPESSAEALRSAASFKVELQERATQITIESGTNLPLDGIQLITPASGFVKAARLEFSETGSQWQLVGEGLPLIRQHGIDALRLPLNQGRTAFIRITVDDSRTAVVPFTGAQLKLAPAAPIPTLPVEVSITSREDTAHETVLLVDIGARNLPMERLEIATPEPLFARVVNVTTVPAQAGDSVERTVSTGSIFRSRVNGLMAREHLVIPLRVVSSQRELRVHIINGNNAALAVERISLQRRPVWLNFDAPNTGTYRLLIGHPAVGAANYDVEQFAAEWKGVPETKTVVSEPLQNPRHRPRDTLAVTDLSGVPLDVGSWPLRKKISPTASGVQEMELDLDLLAHAHPEFRDLRLVREGRQLPYLLDRTPLSRSVSLKAERSDDPKRPQISRWKLNLPRRSLPISSLTLGSDTPLFNRQLRLFELVADRRGELVEHELSATTTWHTSPDQPSSTVTVAITDRPESETVYLETHNGDNPPISLISARVEHPVIRLLFRSTTDELHLYYGFKDARTPVYDIALVSAHLRAGEKHPPDVGPEERVDGESKESASLSSRFGGALLWSSLSVVVIVLLIAIARLLPKPPS
jgi:hypothetical protein